MHRVKNKRASRCCRAGETRSAAYLLATCVALSISQFNCAKMSLQRAPSTEEVVGTRTEPERATALVVRVAQEDQVVRVKVDSKCLLRSYNRVKTTEHSTRTNEQSWIDWTLGISGATLVGIGAWTWADSSRVYPDDTTSRTYNETGPETARGIGVATVLAGAALISVAAVDVARAGGTEDGDATVRERKGEFGGTCPPMPLANAEVEGRLEPGGAVIPLGTTNFAGELEVNLADMTPPEPPGELADQPYGAVMEVLVRGKEAGRVALATAYPAWMAKWRKTQTERDAQAAEKAAEAEKRERENAARAGQSRARVLALLVECERAVSRMKSDRWSAEQSSKFKACFASLQEIDSIAGSAGLTEADLNRWEAVLKKMQALHASRVAAKERKCLEWQAGIDRLLDSSHKAIMQGTCYQTCKGVGGERGVCISRCAPPGYVPPITAEEIIRQRDAQGCLCYHDVCDPLMGLGSILLKTVP